MDVGKQKNVSNSQNRSREQTQWQGRESIGRGSDDRSRLEREGKKIETDVVRQFVNKIDFEKFTYIENFSTKIKHSQRSRRIDYILKYYEKIFLIDVIKNNNEKQKVVRKINDQINEIQEITEVILLVNSKVNFNDLIYDSFNPFVIKWSSE